MQSVQHLRRPEEPELWREPGLRESERIQARRHASDQRQVLLGLERTLAEGMSLAVGQQRPHVHRGLAEPPRVVGIARAPPPSPRFKAPPRPPAPSAEP